MRETLLIVVLCILLISFCYAEEIALEADDITYDVGMSVDNLVEQLDEIDDISIYTNAQEAMKQKYDLDIEFTEGIGANVKNDVFSITTGNMGHVSLNAPVYKNGIFELDEMGNILFAPAAGITSVKIPPGDKVIVVTKTMNIPLILTAPDGTEVSVEGVIMSDGGKLTVPGLDIMPKEDPSLPPGVDQPVKSIINGIAIRTEEKVNIYTDANQFGDVSAHAGENYVLITSDVLAAGCSAKNLLSVEPQPGNALLNMRKREYLKDAEGNFVYEDGEPVIKQLVPDERDKFKIELEKGAQFEIQNRAEEGLTPLFTFSPIGSMAIKTGRLNVYTKTDRIGYAIDTIYTNQGDNIEESVAIEIRNPIKPEISYVISSSNRIAGFDATKNKEIVTVDKGGLIITNDRDYNMFQTLDELMIRYPDILFVTESSDKGPGYSEPSPNMVQSFDQWARSYHALAKRIDKITFTDELEAGEGLDKSGNIRVILGEPVMQQQYVSRIRDIKNPLSVLTHEVGHVTTDKVAVEETIQGISSDDPGTVYNLGTDIANRLATRVTASEPFIQLQEDLEDFQQTYKEMLIKDPFLYTLDEKAVKDFVSDPKRCPLCTKYIFPEGVDKKSLKDINYELTGALNSKSFLKLTEQYEKAIGRIDESALLGFYSYTYAPRNAPSTISTNIRDVIQQQSGLYPYSFLTMGAEAAKISHDQESKLEGEKTTSIEEHLVSFANIKSSQFVPELFTTFAERVHLDPEYIKNQIKADDQEMQDMTQLAFDIDIIPYEDYEYIMDCERNKCGKCLLYTKTCDKTKAISKKNGKWITIR